MAIMRRGSPTSQMSRAQWDPFDVMREFLSGGLAAGGESMLGSESMINPSFEVKETKDAYVFKADLPGMKEEDLDVSLTGNRLTISGKREAEKQEDGERFFAYECSYGSFSRSFTLPEGVDANNVNAELKNGVLRLTVPKVPEVQPRRIQLKKGEEQKKAKA